MGFLSSFGVGLGFDPTSDARNIVCKPCKPRCKVFEVLDGYIFTETPRLDIAERVPSFLNGVGYKVAVWRPLEPRYSDAHPCASFGEGHNLARTMALPTSEAVS